MGPGFTDVIDAVRKEKWFGLRWENIDDKLLLEFTPSKTAEKTGKLVVYPLTKAPMVIEELQHWSAEKRVGPVVLSEATGRPYQEQSWRSRFNKDRAAAGISETVWARDLRASGITEARASNDDAAKVAGHSGTRTTKKVYDRAVLEAADRFADARIRGRERSGNKSGNVR